MKLVIILCSMFSSLTSLAADHLISYNYNSKDYKQY